MTRFEDLYDHVEDIRSEHPMLDFPEPDDFVLKSINAFEYEEIATDDIKQVLVDGAIATFESERYTFTMRFQGVFQSNPDGSYESRIITTGTAGSSAFTPRLPINSIDADVIAVYLSRTLYDEALIGEMVKEKHRQFLFSVSDAKCAALDTSVSDDLKYTDEPTL